MKEASWEALSAFGKRREWRGKEKCEQRSIEHSEPFEDWTGPWNGVQWWTQLWWWWWWLWWWWWGTTFFTFSFGDRCRGLLSSDQLSFKLFYKLFKHHFASSLILLWWSFPFSSRIHAAEAGVVNSWLSKQALYRVCGYFCIFFHPNYLPYFSLGRE